MSFPTRSLDQRALDVLEDDPSYLVRNNELFEDVPPVLIEKLIACTEAVKASVTCEGTFECWEHKECPFLVSASFCQLVQDVSGVDEWHKCQKCTCPCMYDPDIDVGFDNCSTCRMLVCDGCGRGCECSEA